MKNRPNILSVAGFDPSGGAGVLADIKTFEQNKCQGFAVQTANTIQNADEFISCNWVNKSVIFQQIDILLKKHRFDFVKVGLIENIEFLEELCQIDGIKELNIIWDPVLSASAGFDFDHKLDRLKNVLPQLHLVTPNWNEIKILGGNENALAAAVDLSQLTKVYLKGGHNDADKGKDYLFEKGEKVSFNPKNGSYFEKHGSGCIFSSVLTSNLALGYPMNKAILRSKRYIEGYLSSNESKLGIHNF